VAPRLGTKSFTFDCKERMRRGKGLGLSRGHARINRVFQSVRGGGEVWDYGRSGQAVNQPIALIPWRLEEPVKGCGYELAETVHCMNETKKAFVWWSSANSETGDS